MNLKRFSLYLMTCLLSLSAMSHADGIGDYVKDIPGIGLIADEVDFDGIKLRNLSFLTDDSKEGVIVTEKAIVTKPGLKHKVVVDYSIDADVLDTFQLHHFIYGLHNDGPQNCFLRSLGVMNSEGRAEFDVEAPKREGVYQLRFCHATGYTTYNEAKDAWWKSDEATSKTIMGIVVVKK